MTCTTCQLAAEGQQNTDRMIRLLAIVLAFDMIQNMVSPAVWILGASGSIVSTVSRLATWPDALAWAWLVCAALIIPFMATQLAGRSCRRCTRFAVLGLCAGGMLWMYLAFLGRDLDYPALPFLFGFNCMVSVAVGAVLAISINDHQKLEVGASREA
jgi:hypothetical protein